MVWRDSSCVVAKDLLKESVAALGARPKPGTPEPFFHSPFDETRPAFSPDGRWVTYVSDKSGTVYVRSFGTSSGPGGKSQVSTGGGGQPMWSRNQRELFS